MQQKLYWPCFVEIFFGKQTFQLFMQQKNTAALPRVVEIFSYPKKKDYFFHYVCNKKLQRPCPEWWEYFLIPKFFPCMQQKIAAALPRVVGIFSYPKIFSMYAT